MTGTAPGGEPSERTPGNPGPARAPGETRRLDQAPSARYADPRGATAAEEARAGLPGPLLRAAIIALAGAALLVLVGAILASTFGLLFVAGGMGAGIGLALSRAAAPPSELRPTARRTVVLLAVAIALVAVVTADVVTWVIARNEGGTLELVDYLLTTFGPFVPGVAILAALAAWWGASAGPIKS